MTVEFIKPWNSYAPGDSKTFPANVEADLVRLGIAVTEPGGGLVPAMTQTDASGATVLVGAGGNIFRGALVDGAWFTIPSIFRLRITGTGTVTIDAKDSLGNITTGVASYTVSGATDQIEFPYAGDDAVMIRATLSGTTVEVI